MAYLKTLIGATLTIAVSGRSTEEVKMVHMNERQQMVDAINSKEGVTWTAAVQQRFAGQPIGASASLMGHNGNRSEYLATALANGDLEQFVPTWSANVEVPDAFDSVTNWPTCSKILNDIRDQSNCGCCWAFGGAEAASDRMCIATKGKMMFPLSAQDVCFCASADGCGGGQIDTPWTHIKMAGAVTGGQYQGSGPFGKGPVGNDPYPSEGAPGCPSQQSPRCARKCDAASSGKYEKYTFKGAVQTASGVEQIQQMIMEGGPVETAFTVYSDFENYAGGVYKHTSGQMAGGHAVKFVGWGVDSGTKYWKVANSWNPYWGEKGYFRIVMGDSEGNGGIENGVTGSAATATWGPKGPWE